MPLYIERGPQSGRPGIRDGRLLPARPLTSLRTALVVAIDQVAPAAAAGGMRRQLRRGSRSGRRPLWRVLREPVRTTGREEPAMRFQLMRDLGARSTGPLIGSPVRSPVAAPPPWALWPRPPADLRSPRAAARLAGAPPSAGRTVGAASAMGSSARPVLMPVPPAAESQPVPYRCHRGPGRGYLR